MSRVKSCQETDTFETVTTNSNQPKQYDLLCRMDEKTKDSEDSVILVTGIGTVALGSRNVQITLLNLLRQFILL